MHIRRSLRVAVASLAGCGPGGGRVRRARFYVKQLDFEGVVLGQVEVIDRDTRTYVSVKPFTLGEADYLRWRSVTTASWVPPRKNVYVRIGLIGRDIDGELDWFEVDDRDP
jgi:hypothetical protein